MTTSDRNVFTRESIVCGGSEYLSRMDANSVRSSRPRERARRRQQSRRTTRRERTDRRGPVRLVDEVLRRHREQVRAEQRGDAAPPPARPSTARRGAPDRPSSARPLGPARSRTGTRARGDRRGRSRGSRPCGAPTPRRADVRARSPPSAVSSRRSRRRYIEWNLPGRPRKQPRQPGVGELAGDRDLAPERRDPLERAAARPRGSTSRGASATPPHRSPSCGLSARAARPRRARPPARTRSRRCPGRLVVARRGGPAIAWRPTTTG